jgi:hypothetical protein
MKIPFTKISKSVFLAGLQCEKLLWTRFNARDQILPPDARLQAVFDQGHEVGVMARQLFPNGMEVAHGITDKEEVESASRLALQARRPLFEAGFSFGGAFARADILAPVGEDAWDLLEVKGVTEPKDDHLMDLAFQTYVHVGAGLRLRRCFLVHLNRGYVRRGMLEPEGLFVRTDSTSEVEVLCREIKAQLSQMQRVIRKPGCPEIHIGPHCDKPYTCPLRDRCWEFLPENSVMDLYRGKAKGFALLEHGILKVADIPKDQLLTWNQNVQRKAVRSGTPTISKSDIRRFLNDLRYPIHFLDFETFSTAIPIFDLLRPFQRVPFQFSLHVQNSPDATLEHHSFLAEGKGDPRPEFVARLRANIADHGSIVVYNAAFEKGVLKECAEVLPELRSWVDSLQPRFVDLLQPFRSFHYYNPGQHGSASMKAVLPALTGAGYDHLAIRNGDTASQEYLRVTYGDVVAEERQLVRRQLQEYCGLDTMGMHQIIQALNAVT